MKFGLPNEGVFPRHQHFNHNIDVRTAASGEKRVVWWEYEGKWYAFPMKDNDALRALEPIAVQREYLKQKGAGDRGLDPICNVGSEVALLCVLLHWLGG